MFSIDTCPECKVPRYITREHVWLDSGVIVQKNNPSHRLTILDTLDLDPLYQSISDLIGLPIERIITETARRTTRGYMEKLITPEMSNAAKISQEELMGLIDISFQVGRLLGCGDPRLKQLSIGDGVDAHVTIEVSEPYSVPLYFGNFAGTAEVVLGQDCGVTYGQLRDGVFEGTVAPSEHPEEMHERLIAIPYEYKPGNIQLKRCGTCGGPWELSEFAWNLQKGLITKHIEGTRVAIIGPEMLHPVFVELEKELGEAIPHLIIEAQRRNIRSGSRMEWFDTEEAARTELALRGFGELREFTVDSRGMRLQIASACLPLRLTGLVQGLYELHHEVDSRLLWDLSSDDTLEVELEAL